MPLSFHDEMEAFLKHNLEQDDAWQRLTSGQSHTLTQQDIIDTATRMIGVHNQAFLRVAEEIDGLRAAIGTE